MKNLSKITKVKIPLLSVPDKPIVSRTQRHLPIADITEDIVIYKDGGAAIVMESTSLNFGLLSDKEQEAVIAAYAALLNSLSFSIEIIIRSQRKDISDYMDYLEKAKRNIKSPKLLELMNGYTTFISETIKKKNVLGKSFYIAIPFSALELGVAKSALSLTKRKGPLPYPKSYVIKKAKIALYPRRDHLMRQAGRLGLKLRQLSTAQLIELLYTIYNSEPPNVKKTEMEERSQEYEKKQVN